MRTAAAILLDIVAVSIILAVCICGLWFVKLVIEEIAQ